MKTLFVLSHSDFIGTFESVMQELAARGHEVRIGVATKKQPPTLPERLSEDSAIQAMACPPRRRDEWGLAARLLRSLRDFSFYLDPRYSAASQLRQRAQRLLARVASDGRTTHIVSACPMCGARLSGDEWGRFLSELGDAERSNLWQLLEKMETVLPVDPAIGVFLEGERPEVLVVAPLVRLESNLVDFVKAAQSVGIPVVAPVGSWDDLMIDGALHVIPDRLLVWNESQRGVARALHGVPDERIVVTGAPRFDHFVDRSVSTDRNRYCESLELLPGRPLCVFLGSSLLMAPREPAFVDRWVQAVRASTDEAVRRCNIVIRPHPQRRDEYEARQNDWGPHVALDRSDDPQRLFDCLTHAAIAVGINTGAMLEAALVGTPVYSLLVPGCAGGQQDTVHFHRLLRSLGGFVELSHTLQGHLKLLGSALETSAIGDRAGAESFVWAPGEAGRATTLTVNAIENAGRGAASRGLLSWVRASRPVLSGVGAAQRMFDRDVDIPVAGSIPLESGCKTSDSLGNSEVTEQVAGAVPDAFLASLEGTDLSTLANDGTISEFWKHQIANARARAESNTGSAELRVADVVAELGYTFRPLADGLEVDEDPSLRRALEAWKGIKPMVRRSGSKVPGLSLDEWEHVSALAWLEQEELLDDYLAFIRPFRIKSSMTAIRHYYRARVLEQLCGEHLGRRNLHVLEVGAGAGNLATFLLSTGFARSYVIVDLPEMLMNASLNISRYWPDAVVHADAPPGNPEPGHVYLVRTADISALVSEQFDVAVNFNSFMEMDRAARDLYISEMYRTAKNGAILYNVNRRQAKLPQSDGSLFDNNPLLYPYVTHDHVLFWEDDPFETAVRAWFGKRPSVAIARAEIVRKR